MSRNMNSAMNSIFNSLVPTGSQKDVDRYYVKENADGDKDWLQYSVITHIEKSTYYPFVIGLFSYDSESYFYITNCDYSFNPPDGFTLQEINAGIFSLLISETKVNRKTNISDDKIENEVFFIEPTDADYSGNDFLDLKSFFNDIIVFKKIDTTVDSIHKTFADTLICNKEYVKTINEESIYSLLQDNLVIKSDVIDELIASALFAKQHSHTFIDLYKLLEILYPISYIEALFSKLSITNLSFKNFYDLVVDELNWKYIENKALTRLYGSMSVVDTDLIKSEFEKIDCDEKDIPQYIYKIRCNIVHRRFGQINLALTEVEWNVLFQIILKMTKKLYVEYKTILDD